MPSQPRKRKRHGPENVPETNVTNLELRTLNFTHLLLHLSFHVNTRGL
jgi:hypothetical protein